MDNIPSWIVGVLGGGTVLAVIVKGLFDKKKEKATTTETLVETAIKLSDASAQRYTEISKHLEFSEMHLMEARKQLIYERSYIQILEALLKEHGIDIPARPDIKDGGS